MLNGRNISFEEIAGVTPESLLAAKLAAESCICFYSRIRGIAEIHRDLDLESNIIEQLNVNATEEIQSHGVDWRDLLNQAVLGSISLGNAGHSTAVELEYGITFPTVHAAANELNDWLWSRWICKCGGVANCLWEEVWSMPQLPPQLLDELLARIDFEWRNATAAAEKREVGRVPTIPPTRDEIRFVKNQGGAPSKHDEACNWAWPRRVKYGMSYAALAKAFNEAHPGRDPISEPTLRSGINTRLKTGKLEKNPSVENLP